VNHSIAFIGLIAFALITRVALAAELPTAAVPPTPIYRAKTAPVIDGKLDDACWQRAVVIVANHLYAAPGQRTEPPPLVARGVYAGGGARERGAVLRHVKLLVGPNWCHIPPFFFFLHFLRSFLFFFLLLFVLSCLPV
jgi:hypothetical protein